MKNPDEPLFDLDAGAARADAPADPAVRERIRRLVDKQPYAVLCVQGRGQPYGALVAFAFSQDLRHVIFVTPVATRKYRLLSECDHVALVVTNFREAPHDSARLAYTFAAEEVALGAAASSLARVVTAPNPFVGSTRIVCYAPRDGEISSVRIYDTAGRLVRSRSSAAGSR